MIDLNFTNFNSFITTIINIFTLPILNTLINTNIIIRSMFVYKTIQSYWNKLISSIS